MSFPHGVEEYQSTSPWTGYLLVSDSALPMSSPMPKFDIRLIELFIESFERKYTMADNANQKKLDQLKEAAIWEAKQGHGKAAANLAAIHDAVQEHENQKAKDDKNAT